MLNKFKYTALAIVVAGSLSACSQSENKQGLNSSNAAAQHIAANATDATDATYASDATKAPLTAQDAADFLARAAKESVELLIEGSRAEWIYQNYITDDTAALSAAANQKSTEAGVRYAMEAAKFDHVNVSAEHRRQLNILKQSLVIPAPQDPQKSAELAKIGAQLGAMYGKGTYTTKAGEKMSLGDMSAKMASSRDYNELLELWQGWRTISPDMKSLYTRQTALANEGANGLGYKDLGTMWRSNYDMPADDFAKELDRLWGQVKPLYDDLHCYVRSELGEQ